MKIDIRIVTMPIMCILSYFVGNVDGWVIALVAVSYIPITISRNE